MSEHKTFISTRLDAAPSEKKARQSRDLIRNNPKVALSRSHQELFALPPMVRTSAVSYKP